MLVQDPLMDSQSAETEYCAQTEHYKIITMSATTRRNSACKPMAV